MTRPAPAAQPTVLFIDDDGNLLDGLARSLRREPFAVACCVDLDAARARLEQGGVDVVVCDEHMPGVSGSDFLAEIRRAHPATVRIMLTGQGTVGAAVQAVNGGEIFRFLLKPCAHGELADTLHQALAHKRLMDRCRAALRLLQRHNALLETIARRWPEIAAEARAAASSAAAVAAEADEGEVAERIDVEIVRARGAVGE
jgi:DNA-binding NtrC family response regulator